MKRILSVFLLIAMTVSTFAILPAQAAAPITSTEEDSIVPSPWDSIETEGGAFSSEIEEAGLTYAAQGAETYGARSSSLPFRDVSSSSWFYDEVVYVYEAGLMDGISSTEFAPNASLTRAEVVTVLYRLDGSPAVDGGSAFTDVPDGAFYSKPVAWASQNGIVEGVGNHEFLPKKSITREQIATIFYRYYAGYLGNSAPSSSLSGYTDQGSVSGFAREPMAWAVYSGLIRGINASHEAPRLEPQSTSTRAQVATPFTAWICSWKTNPAAAPAKESSTSSRSGRASPQPPTGITLSTPSVTAPTAAPPGMKCPPPTGTALHGTKRKSSFGNPLPVITKLP